MFAEPDKDTLTVDFTSRNPVRATLTESGQPPYINWLSAATNIQDAIDVALDFDNVLVTNGVYDTGGVVVHDALTNRLAITNAVTVRSVNGPDSTFIVGSGPLGDTAVRCAYLGDGARLKGFTLTNGHTRASGNIFTERSGAGAWCEPSAVLSNCTITGNAGTWRGGGTYGGTVQNCVVTGNSSDWGGGTYGGMIQNCRISGNTARTAGGGTYGGTVENCTITAKVMPVPAARPGDRWSPAGAR